MLLVLLLVPDVPAPNLEEINSLVAGKLGDLCYLSKDFDRERVSKVYGISSTEFESYGKEGKAFVLSVVTRMSASLLSR